MLFNVVKLFCYGDCTDYLQSKAEVGYELNPAEINKLQLLSLISLASQVRYSKVIPFHTKFNPILVSRAGLCKCDGEIRSDFTH